MPPASQLSVRVTRVRSEADDVLSYLLADAAGGELPDWTPGAHIDVCLPDGMTRQYSLCGDPADRRRWRIAVLLEADGRGGSRYLHERVTSGAVLPVSAPRNNFPLIDSPRYVFVAGGIGITPLLPMIEAADRTGADWTLHYGGRSADRMSFADDLAEYGDRVRLYPQDRFGLIPLDLVLGPEVDGAAVYCCGPEPLLHAVEQAQRRRAAGSLHVERFHPKEIEAGPDRAFEVVLRSTGQVVPVAAGQSVLAGEVEHRDSVLTDEERAAGRSMMLCVSRARSDRLVLDL